MERAKRGMQGARATAWMVLVAIFKRRGQGKEGCPDVTIVTCSSITERVAYDLQINLGILQSLVVVQVSYRAAHLEQCVLLNVCPPNTFV